MAERGLSLGAGCPLKKFIRAFFNLDFRGNE